MSQTTNVSNLVINKLTSAQYANISSPSATELYFVTDGAYGDISNPYGAKPINTVLAGPSSGSSAAPSFRALTAADIPDLSSTYATFQILTGSTVPSSTTGNNGDLYLLIT